MGRKSGQSFYQESFATFEEDQVYNQADAGGFIRFNGLRLRIQAMQKKVTGKMQKTSGSEEAVGWAFCRGYGRLGGGLYRLYPL